MAAPTWLAALADEVTIDLSSRREPAEKIFRPIRPSFVARERGGIDAGIEPLNPSHRIVYDPRDAKAKEEGLVAAPNVNLEEN